MTPTIRFAFGLVSGFAVCMYSLGSFSAHGPAAQSGSLEKSSGERSIPTVPRYSFHSGPLGGQAQLYPVEEGATFGSIRSECALFLQDNPGNTVVRALEAGKDYYFIAYLLRTGALDFDTWLGGLLAVDSIPAEAFGELFSVIGAGLTDEQAERFFESFRPAEIEALKRASLKYGNASVLWELSKNAALSNMEHSLWLRKLTSALGSDDPQVSSCTPDQKIDMAKYLPETMRARVVHSAVLEMFGKNKMIGIESSRAWVRSLPDFVQPQASGQLEQLYERAKDMGQASE